MRSIRLSEARRGGRPRNARVRFAGEFPPFLLVAFIFYLSCSFGRLENDSTAASRSLNILLKSRYIDSVMRAKSLEWEKPTRWERFVESTAGIGRSITSRVALAGNLAVFSAATIFWLAVKGAKRETLTPAFYNVGVLSLPVVMLTGTFIGMVLAVQSYPQFKLVGLETRIGAAINGRMPADPAYNALICRHFNSITADNQMKPMFVMDREATLAKGDPLHAAEIGRASCRERV